MSNQTINTNLVFNNNNEVQDFIKNKYPNLYLDILNNSAEAVYIDNQQQLESLINNNKEDEIHLFKMDNTLQKYYENGIAQQTLHQNSHLANNIHYCGSFVSQTSLSINGQDHLPSWSYYASQINHSIYYIVSKSLYNTDIAFIKKKYRNCQLIETASELTFFNNKIDLGRSLRSISISKLNNTNNRIVVSTPWLYKTNKNGIRRYTLEMNIYKDTFEMYEYNVFNKKSNSSFLGCFREINDDFAISSFVNKINKINACSRSEVVSYEIYNYETMHKFCQITGFDINSIPDFLSEGKMFYYDKDNDNLLERSEYVKKKNLELKKMEKLEKKKKIQEQLQKIKEENNGDGKMEAIGFLESLLNS